MNNSIPNFIWSELLPTYQTYFTKYVANIKTPATKNPYRSVLLFDLTGRSVLQKSKSGFSLASFNFSTSSMSSGIYVIQVETEKKTIFRKLIIK